MGFLTDDELRRAATGRNAAEHHADPHADHFQRRVHSRTTERTAKAGRGPSARHGRRTRQEAGPGSPPVFSDRSRHGGGVRGDERHIRRCVRREQSRSGDARHGAGARRCAQRPVHHGHAHAFPARRHAHPDLRASARGGRQGRLEPGAGRQAADHRGPEVEQLLQGSVPRQRHQDRADLQRALRHSAGLVPDQRYDDCRARSGQQGGGLQAHDGARHLHAGPAGLARSRSSMRCR